MSLSGLLETNLRQIFILSLMIVICFLNLTRRIICTSKYQLFTVKGYVLKDYACCHQHLQNTLNILYFRKRSYPKKHVDNQLRRVVKNRPQKLLEHQTKHENGVPFAVTYHPWLHNLGRIIRKYFVYLYAKEQIKRVFKPASFLSFDQVQSQESFIQSKSVPHERRERFIMLWENQV